MILKIIHAFDSKNITYKFLPLFFWVRAISFSISEIFSKIPIFSESLNASEKKNQQKYSPEFTCGADDHHSILSFTPAELTHARVHIYMHQWQIFRTKI